MEESYNDEIVLQTSEEESIGRQNIGKYSWTDITEEFKSACSELKLGELLHDSKFSLIEGMSAIEMMDPKMDAGMTYNTKKDKVKSFEQALEEGYLKSEGFTAEELIGIIDDSYACFMSWLEGHSLAQTVFINLYMHEPHLVRNKLLSTFCSVMLKMVAIVRYNILKASVFEEEDFQPTAYNFKLDIEADNGAFVARLKEVEEELNRSIKGSKKKTEQSPANEVLLTRIKFTRSLLFLLCALPNDKVGDLVPMIEKHTKTLLEVQASITNQTPKQTCVDGEEGERTFSMGFYPSINQRLLPPTFPRCVSIMSTSHAYQAIYSLVYRLKHILKVVELKNFQDIFEFCSSFSKSSPCLLSRSILQLLIFPLNKRVFGRESLLEVVKESIRSFSAPSVLLHSSHRSHISNNVQARDCTEAFVYRSIHFLLFVIQTTGHNRARQRDRWAKLLEEFKALQGEAEKLDSFLHSLNLKIDPSSKLTVNFTTWVFHWSLRTMLLFLLSGLELELYAEHEYTYIFWYLSEGLYSWMSNTLDKAESFLHDAEVWKDANAARHSKRNKRCSKRRSRQHSNELIFHQALYHLTGGYYKAIIGLGLENKLHVPKFDFDLEEVRYNRRFGPFSSVPSPPQLSYTCFKKNTDVASVEPPIKAEDLFISAAYSFNQAKTLLETITKPNEEVAAILKVARTNMVVIRILQNADTKYSKIKPEFSFEMNKFFPTIKLPAS